MKRDPGISVVLLRPIAASVGRLGGDAKAFLESLGVTADTDADDYVPAARVVAALDRFPKGASLALAEASPVGSLGFLDYLFITSANLREALARAVRFYGLATELVSLEVESRDGCVRLVHTLNGSAPRVVLLTELAFAAFVSRARAAVRDDFRLRRVSFTHRVSDPRPFDAYFGVAVAFGAPVDELLFDAVAADRPFSTADPTTAAFLEAQGARMQASVGVVDSFRGRARTAIARGLRSKSFDVISLARGLHLSTRNYQRLLEQHGTSHRDLVAEVQRELAVQLLARRDMSMIEVAFELGFAQQAAFHRAFVRWTGATPGAYRKTKLEGSPR